jgi:hypothetical protein
MSAVMGEFDFERGAGLFTRKYHVPRSAAALAAQPNAGKARARSMHRNAMTYRRFATGAEAIRFAVEELPPAGLAASVLEIDATRFEAGAIRDLYESVAYPLARRATPKVWPGQA